jgi:hypothetical protein
MALTNNTKYRRITLTINKKVNGSVVTSGGFPKTHSIMDAFGSYTSLTLQQLQTITDAAFNLRLNDFYAFLEGLYFFFNRSFVLNAPSGTDAVLCPLDNSPSPVIQVVSVEAELLPVFGGSVNNYLVWSIIVAQPVTIDTPYQFRVLLTDEWNNPIRYEICYGIIKANQSSNYSNQDNFSTYIPEADLYGPVNVVVDFDSIVI